MTTISHVLVELIEEFQVAKFRVIRQLLRGDERDRMSNTTLWAKGDWIYAGLFLHFSYVYIELIHSQA